MVNVKPYCKMWAGCPPPNLGKEEGQALPPLHPLTAGACAGHKGASGPLIQPPGQSRRLWTRVGGLAHGITVRETQT